MNKKSIVISLLVIISAITVSGCLEPTNEDDIYNEEMENIKQDLKEVDEVMNKINSANNSDISSTLSEIDFAITTLDNDSKKLEDLNNSVTNTTRKEYIGLWIKYIEISKKSYVELKNVTNLIKNYNNTNMSLNEVMSIIENSYKIMSKYDEDAKSIEEKIKECENKTSIVLINGTTSVYEFDVENNITTDSN